MGDSVHELIEDRDADWRAALLDPEGANVPLTIKRTVQELFGRHPDTERLDKLERLLVSAHLELAQLSTTFRISGGPLYVVGLTLRGAIDEIDAAQEERER